MKQGKVILSYAGQYQVYCQGEVFILTPRGVIKYKSKDLVAGDEVLFDEETLTIEKILPRINFINRPRLSNIEQMLIVSSCLEPELSPLLIYKTITYALMHEVKPIVVISKIDKLDNYDGILLLQKQLALIHLPVILYSKRTKVGLKEIEDYLKDKVTLLIGQTGVGKSSLINLLDASFDRTIGEYSKALGRGKHQTKDVFFLKYKNGFVVDSPGFSSLELQIYKEDLAQFFPGFEQAIGKCFFNDCQHLNEKDCEVKRLVEQKIISQEAYMIYQKLHDELQYKWRRFRK